MEFTVSKADLVRELSLSQGVVEKKTTIPILSNVLLEADGDRITLTATDLELGIRCSCPARVKKEGAGTIPARKLLDYVRLLPEGDVNMKFLENHWASITCGRSRTRIAGMSRESFPELPQMPEHDRRDSGEDALASMIARTSFAISMEESRFTLNGALLLLRPEGLTMVATDGHRLAFVQSRRSERPGASSSFGRWFPRRRWRELTKLADDAGPDGQGDLRGRRQSSVFPGRPPAADHPQADRQFSGLRTRAAEGSYAFRDAAERDEIRSAIERVAQFADERSRAIRVQFTTAKCACSLPRWKPARAKRAFQRVSAGRISRSASMRSTCSISCARFRRTTVAFELKDQKSAGELRPAGEGIADQYRYVVMPMRI